jgi:hypothetical protein
MTTTTLGLLPADDIRDALSPAAQRARQVRRAEAKSGRNLIAASKCPMRLQPVKLGRNESRVVVESADAAELGN